MIVDAKCMYCEAKSVTAAATSDVVDFGHDYPTTGLRVKPFFIVVQPDADFAGTGTLAVALQDSADNSTFTSRLAATIDAATLLKGPVAIPFPVKHERYTRLAFTPTTITAGAVTAYITDTIELPMEVPLVGVEYIQTID